jgi:hypothetical protein
VVRALHAVEVGLHLQCYDEQVKDLCGNYKLPEGPGGPGGPLGGSMDVDGAADGVGCPGGPAGRGAPDNWLISMNSTKNTHCNHLEVQEAVQCSYLAVPLVAEDQEIWWKGGLVDRWVEAVQVALGEDLQPVHLQMVQQKE